jgi:shikimate dehydrogenase
MMPMHFYFIGVTTKQSAIARILPMWSEVLNTDLNLIGIDLPIDADPSQYRKAVSHLKNDPKALGSVVTTHGADMLVKSSPVYSWDTDTALHLASERRRNAD